MKKIIALSIIFLMIGTITCSKKDDDNGFPTLPSSGDWAWPQFGINTILFIWQTEFEKDNYVEVEILHFSDNVPQSSELKINDNIIAVPDTSEWSEEEWYVGSHVYKSYYYWIDSDEVPELANIQAGETVSYSVKINNITDTGSLKAGYPIYGSFPDFNVEQDYHFSWTVQENPNLHYVFFDMGDYSNKYYIYKNWRLSGTAREYTISKSLYQDFIENDYWVWVEVDAINYKRSDDFLAMSDSWDYYESDRKSSSGFDRKLHRQRLVKALLNDIDNL